MGWYYPFNLLFYTIKWSIIIKDIIDENVAFLFGEEYTHGYADHVVERPTSDLRAFKFILKHGKIIHAQELSHFRQPFMAIICSNPAKGYQATEVKLTHCSAFDYRLHGWRRHLEELKEKQQQSNNVYHKHRVMFYVHGAFTFFFS
jgi:hypothetical protein